MSLIEPRPADRRHRTRQCSGPSRRVSFQWFESWRGAGAATDRHSVMRHSRLTTIFAIVLGFPVVVAGCSSSANYDPRVRRERLLAIYPPGQTTRADVQKQWAPINPEFTVARPADGWAALDMPRVCERIAASEQRAGKPVQLVECYVGPDSHSSFDFLGLCYCWFYYDAADKVVDAEWQYHTD